MAEALRDGRFVCLGALGAGAQGTTYDGVDKREGRAVAIKEFDVRGARGWKDVELAEREARVLSSLKHPKLPAYIDHFEEDGKLYLVMEKIEGESLGALRKRGAILAESDVIRLLRDASDVLDYLHGRAPPVIHRDLKPNNVVRRPDGSFAFVDFGAVRDKLKPQGGSTVVGTFGYMAPEQFQGRAAPGSDVYAIGATALAVLTGVEPEDLPHKGLAVDVEAALRGRASRRLTELLTQMLEPDPDKRPSRIAPLLKGLDETAERARNESRDGTRAKGSKKTDREKYEWERNIEDAGRKRSRRRDERHARREEKRAAREASREGARVGGRRYGAPWPVLLLVSLALTVAQLAVVLSLRVVLPIVLTMLSLLFGRALRDAARSVSDAGERAGRALTRARYVTRARLQPRRAEEQVQVRVVSESSAPSPSPIRVADESSDEAHARAVATEEEAEHERQEKRGKRR